MKEHDDYDARLNGVKVMTICIVILCISLFAGYCSAHAYPPAPRLTYPVGSFAECAGHISYHFDSLGHDCECRFQEIHPRYIHGHIDGVRFVVTTKAWRSFPEMDALPIIWMIDEQVAVEAVLAGVGR